MMTLHKKHTSHSSSEFIQLVCDIIHEKIGIVVKPDNNELKKFIKLSFDEHSESYQTYINKLKVASVNSELMVKMISAITIGETYFFRDKKQMEVLESYVIPDIIAKKRKQNKKSIRVWSAGCSSGEEIYTLIILFSKLIPDINQWKFHFLGTDINVDQLNKARIGKYNQWSMRSISKIELDQYFIQSNNSYQIKDQIKNKARFDYLNLNNDFYPSLLNGTSDQDLILCRNVLIYFDVDHASHILKKISHSLCDHGYLLIGASDPGIKDELHLSHSGVIPSLFIKSQIPINSCNDKLFESSSLNKSDDEVFNIKNIYQIISELESQSDWENVIKIANESLEKTKEYPVLFIKKASALANIGKNEEALLECEKCLQIDPLNREAYFIKALIYNETQQIIEAEKSFTQALFIDPKFLICRYEFGLFLIRNNQYEKGVRMLANTKQDALEFDKDTIVPYTNEIQYEDLIYLLENELKVHSQHINEDSK